MQCSTNHSKFNISCYTFPSSVYACSVSPITSVKEPYSYKQASLDPNWLDAMSKELSALEANHTWSIVPLPSGKKVVGCKWVYRVKYLQDGSIDKYKTRLVA